MDNKSASRMVNSVDITIDAVTNTLANTLSTSEYTHNLQRIGIFGSVARGATRKSSDVDLLLDYRHDEKSFDYFYLCEQIEQAIKKQYGRSVSLVEASALEYDENRDIGDEIKREVVWVYGKDKK